MLTYILIDYIVYTFKAGHEHVPLRGKPQVLQDNFSSYFMFCVTIFAAKHVYAHWKILYMCMMLQNYTPLPLFSQYASCSTNICTLCRKRIYNLVLVHCYAILHLINQIGMHLHVLIEGVFFIFQAYRIVAYIVGFALTQPSTSHV